MTFRPTTGGVPDEIDEELALLGENPEGSVSPELRALDDWWRARPRALPTRHEGPARPRTDAGRWGFGFLLAAAAVGAFVVGRSDPSPLRPMGALAIDLAATRSGAPVETGRLQEGDLLFVALTAPSDGCVSVGTVGPLGAEILAGAEVRAGQRFTLDGALRLDGQVGAEWLVVQIDGCGAPVALDASPRPGRYVHDITRARR